MHHLVKKVVLALMFVALLPAVVVAKPVMEKGEMLVQPKQNSPVIVPDNFLRRWDPVTVFFDSQKGEAPGTPEDNPANFVKVSPVQPGAWVWLDRKTLQFRPADPWPVLSKFSFSVGKNKVLLHTLMSAPTATTPKDGAKNLEPFDLIVLNFKDKLDTARLKSLMNLEIRTLPGVEAGHSRFLSADDYTVKEVEFSQTKNAYVYYLQLREKVAFGHKLIVNVRLSENDRLNQSFAKLVFATAKPFMLSGAGCDANILPMAPDGSRYTKEQAIECNSGSLRLEFTDKLEQADILKWRNFVRISPKVDDLTMSVAGNRLVVNGKFKPRTLYRLDIRMRDVKSRGGRDLQMSGASGFYFSRKSKPAFLSVDKGHGILERFGPKAIPVKGRNHTRVDVRIHKIDPLDPAFWPFTETPVTTDDFKRPPGPGEQKITNKMRQSAYPDSSVLAGHIRQLGSPLVSKIYDLPLKNNGMAANFGVNLAPMLAEIEGDDRTPGTYLVGLRPLGKEGTRSWMRLQVTDLALTTVEEKQNVVFAVTSLADGRPVTEANIRVEGFETVRKVINTRAHSEKIWTTFVQAQTGKDGRFSWAAPGYNNNAREVRRIVVQKNADIIVLNVKKPPEHFADGRWSEKNWGWLNWVFNKSFDYRAKTQEMRCHLFSERPVYKPQDPVHLKAYARYVTRGKIKLFKATGLLNISSGDMEWDYKLDFTNNGSAYHKFIEDDLPSGVYTAKLSLEDDKKTTVCQTITFIKEPYVLPKFEVLLSGPSATALDAPFTINMAARYYAGGDVAGQKVDWRVHQYPYHFTPKAKKGFVFSTDSRFTDAGAFPTDVALVSSDKTDETGAAKVTIDPTVQQSARPRRYVIEAIVTGADDQPVSATTEVLGLPPVILGVNVPRYIADGAKITPEIAAFDGLGKAAIGHDVTVNLYRRRWTAVLQAGNFAQGTGRYLTSTIDEKIDSQSFVSDTEALKPEFAATQPGVYLVEAVTKDAQGRRVALKVDLFVAGKGAVSWDKPPAKELSLTTDQKDYGVGDRAKIVLQSPFETGRALVVEELPDHTNRYTWLDVADFAAVHTVEVNKSYMPRLPVHVLLMRGRNQVKTDEAQNPNKPDFAKPATLAATTYVTIRPDAHHINVKVDAPQSVAPGATVNATITLADNNGNPLSGEVTLWLVDQAVLALGDEQRLSIMPDFVVNRGTHLDFRDTRNMAFGFLPLVENPGGDEGTSEKDDLLDKVTIRKDFKAVAYYNPAVKVGNDGTAMVTIKMPDNLTNFKLRAKAVSAQDMFGLTTGKVSIRLPVIVQPALPAFVRTGDSFTAAAIGRIVTGKGGKGKAQMKADGLNIEGAETKTFDWPDTRPERIEYDVHVPSVGFGGDGLPLRNAVQITMGVTRSSDNASDAFEVTLPLLPDRRPELFRRFYRFDEHHTQKISGAVEKPRDGTFNHSLLLSGEPAMTKMAAGLSYLAGYPHGCVEQKISTARVFVAARKFNNAFNRGKLLSRDKYAVQSAVKAIEDAMHNNGLLGYWPGSETRVAVSAWALQFLTEAREAGYDIDTKIMARLSRGLQSTLRSDYTRFIAGGAYTERSWALAALAQAGDLPQGYASELARRATYLDQGGRARVLYALLNTSHTGKTMVKNIYSSVDDGIIRQLRNGREVYAGLQEKGLDLPEILSGETATLAQTLKATVAYDGGKKLSGLLKDGLVNLGRGNGWGATNANAEAFLALSEYLDKRKNWPDATVTIAGDSGTKLATLKTGGNVPMAWANMAKTGGLKASLGKQASKTAVLVSELRYMPAEFGGFAMPVAKGFAVTRTQTDVYENSTDVVTPLDKKGIKRALKVGDVVEDHVEVVVPQDSYHVAIVVPLAAGMTYMNPNLKTATSQAVPSAKPTARPTYTARKDDEIAFYYSRLDKGTYHVYLRARATVAGRFSQPPAYAEKMYDETVYGQSYGARVIVTPAKQASADGVNNATQTP